MNKKSNAVKFAFVAAIVALSVGLDQASKIWADGNLSSLRYDHAVSVEVPADASGMTLGQLVDARYPGEPADNRQRIAGSVSRPDGSHVMPSDPVEPGEQLRFRYVSKTVIEGYYDYQYARNPGAAWSFLANQPERFRTIFFGITGIIAVILFTAFIAVTKWSAHKARVFFLACILGGAVGNIIDRFRLGYVIDFISWHVGEHYWPTFNVADIFVTGGVAFLVIEMFLHRDEEKSGKSDKSGKHAPEVDGAQENKA